MKNLVVFGDSWSWGWREIDEVIELLKQEKRLDKVSLDNGTAYKIEDRYSILIAKHYGSDVIDFSSPGLSNRQMTYLLMDSILTNNLNSKTDFVIVMFTTWIRNSFWYHQFDKPEWGNYVYKYNYNNELPIKISSYQNYTPISYGKHHDEDEHELSAEYLKESAYAQFVDYNFITNLLETNNFQYVIGWNWHKPKDFCKYLSHKYYEKNIKNNNRVLDRQFVDFFIDWIAFALPHPSEEEHKLYAEYLIDKIKPYNDRM